VHLSSANSSFRTPPLTTPRQPPVVTIHVATGTTTVATPRPFPVPFGVCSEQERKP
jgi:hypothetical protein